MECKIEEFGKNFDCGEKIKELFKYLPYDKFPGLYIGIRKRNGSGLRLSYGHADLQKKVPINKYTVFRAGSLSKPFTALGVLLSPIGPENINTPVNNYFDKPMLIPPKGRRITVRHLLTHTSGIGELPSITYLFRKGFGLNIKPGKTIPPLSYLHGRPLKTTVPPGIKFAYSNFGYSFLGYLTERVTGESWHRYIAKKIIEPQGLDSVRFYPKGYAPDEDITTGNGIKDGEDSPFYDAIGYIRKGKKFRPSKIMEQIIAPAGGLRGAAVHLENFFSELNRSFAGEGFFNSSIVRKMCERLYYTHPLLSGESSVGAGLFITNVHGLDILYHGGATYGFTAFVAMLPQPGITVLVLANVDEIFGKRYTIKIASEIIGELIKKIGSDYTDYDESRETSEVGTENTELNQKVAHFIGGYYTPPPGILTNTRVYMGGGPIRLRFVKNTASGRSALFYSRCWGPERKKKEVKISGITPDGDYIIDIGKNFLGGEKRFIIRRIRKNTDYPTKTVNKTGGTNIPRKKVSRHIIGKKGIKDSRPSQRRKLKTAVYGYLGLHIFIRRGRLPIGPGVRRIFGILGTITIITVLITILPNLL